MKESVKRGVVNVLLNVRSAESEVRRSPLETSPFG
jgi:hypothetical protein